LTLDEDVVVLLKRAMARQNLSLQKVVNDALRHGLSRQVSRRSRSTRFETRGMDLGRCLMPNLDNIAQVLAVSASEDSN
jgi:hypothetical protein